MAIIPADVLIKFSEKSGTAGNQNAGTPAGSLGKYISTTLVTDASLHNLFDIVSGDENEASDVEYRCIFVHNSHGTLVLENAVVWLSAETGGGADAAIAIDDVAASPIGQASAQADEVADEDTAPSGESFSSPTTKGSALSLGNIPAGECRSFWIRRSAANTGAVDNDDVTIQVDGDTAA